MMGLSDYKSYSLVPSHMHLNFKSRNIDIVKMRGD